MRAEAPDPAPTPGAVRAPHPGFGSGARLWLVRHGTVHEDWQGIAYGDLDVPLSEAGRGETAELVRRFSALRPTRVLSSPLARSLEVGRALAEASGAPLVVEADLREIHRGSWQGRRVDELRATDADLLAAFYADPWTFRAHGGESDELLLARVWRVIEGALRGQEAHADEPATLVLTVHYNVIRVVAAHLLGIRPDRSFAFRIDPARAALFEDSPLGWKLHAANVSGPPRDELLELAELERSSPNAAGGPGACPTAAGGPGA